MVKNPNWQEADQLVIDDDDVHPLESKMTTIRDTLSQALNIDTETKSGVAKAIILFFWRGGGGGEWGGGDSERMSGNGEDSG